MKEKYPITTLGRKEKINRWTLQAYEVEENETKQNKTTAVL